FPYPALKLFEERSDVLESAFSYYVQPELSVTAANSTESLLGQYVSGNYFHGMGVVPAAGRFIQPDEDGLPPAAVAVVSHRFGARRFGDARAALGQTIRVNDQSFTLIGVAPKGFFGAEPGAVPDVYLPLHASPMSKGGDLDEHFYWTDIMARLKP